LFDRKRLVVGLFASALGVALVRANGVLLGEGSPHLTATYLLGVFLGLAGLAVVASSMKRSSQSMVQCPHCMALNPGDAKNCSRCRRAIAEP